jgi:hypothetical protein
VSDSFAGFACCEVKGRDGSENAAAKVLDAELEEDVVGCNADEALPAPNKEGAVSLRRGRL